MTREDEAKESNSHGCAVRTYHDLPLRWFLVYIQYISFSDETNQETKNRKLWYCRRGIWNKIIREIIDSFWSDKSKIKRCQTG